MPLKNYPSIEVAIEKYLEDLELDDMNQARAQIALALARSLDSAEDATSGAYAQSVPGTAKELRETLKDIDEHIIEGDTFIEGLMNGD